MRLWYVFDPREEDGYVIRLPRLLAKLAAHVLGLDYAKTEGGY